MTIERVKSILSPPSRPTDVPKNDDWQEIEARMGTLLPSDYKEFVNKYGTGRIANFLWIFNPFSRNENLNLETQLDRQRDVFADLESFGEVLPYKLFPKDGGIFPFAMTDNGDVLFWRTCGNPDQWSLVVNDARSPEWQEFALPFGEFLFELLSGRLVCVVFPRSFPGESLKFDTL
ncbi:SMI1/KNR4 family protein [Methylomonas methanica]|jgi:hypothetical protein|uniref:Knr4/Smi1-like domain-containing protein n=1 Tax=Methylomonas methanica TaxID=421 RepID=A0A177LXY3_METMH|nr:SMI1/KNR4 family protein [Methylomonas methanica]OAH97874.1 hypothetical protein A1332_21155 [Methylomonas methanica]